MMKHVIVVTVALGFMAGSAWSKDPAANSSFRSELREVSPLELPAKAAALVSKSAAKEREAVAVAVVKTIIQLHPTTSAAVVSSIAQTSPEVAPAAAATAAVLQPKMAPAIARAAAAAAPDQAAKIVLAVCRAVPMQYRSVSLAVSQAVPSAAADILEGVGAAVPALKPYLSRARNSVVASGDELTVASVLAKADNLVAADGSPHLASAQAFSGTLPPPVIGPPFVAITNNVVPPQIDGSTSGEVVGPRPPDYSSP